MKYISCEWIESRVVLELEQLKFCCIGHSGNKGYVPICDYQGGDLPVDEIRAARADLIRRNNDPAAESGCKGCHFLQKKDWDKERKTDALFQAVYISSFSICNLSCRYCFVYLREFTEVSNVKGYDLLPVFQEMIGKRYLADDAYIEWGGGEPTIVKNFAEVMQLLLKQGYEQQIHTSSVRFSKEVEDGLRSGHVRAVTSVDAGTPEAYHEVKGRDVFDKVWETVGRYAATGGDMTVKYILRHNNSSEANVRGFIERVKQAGVHKLVATPDFRELVQKQITEETIAAFALLVHLAEQEGLRIELRDEYVSPAQMKTVKKYIPWTEGEARYQAWKVEDARRAEQARAAREARRLENADRTAEAVRLTEESLAKPTGIAHPFQLLEEAPGTELPVLDLLAHQTDVPTPELRQSLTRFVRARSIPGQLKLDGVTALGVSADAWTLNGDPGYLVIDATDSDEPLTRELWFTCWAGADDYPIRLTIADGSGEDIEYTFLEPLQLRMEMPTVPAGESAIWSVRTDKSWVPTTGTDARHLGVQISTGI